MANNFFWEVCYQADERSLNVVNGEFLILVILYTLRFDQLC